MRADNLFIKKQLTRCTHPYAFILLLLLFAGCGAGNKSVKPEPAPAPITPETTTPNVADTAPQEAINHYLAGTVAEEANDLATATIEFQLARQYDPNSLAIGIALSRVYLKIGQTAAAINLLEQVRRDNPADGELAELLVFVYDHEERYEDGYKLLVELDSLRMLTKYERLRLAGFCYETKRLGDAIANYKRYIAEFEEDAEIWEQIGRLEILRREVTASEQAFRKAVAIDFYRPDTHFILGSMAVDRNDYDQGIGDFFNAIKADSAEPKHWTAVISLLMRQKQFERSLSLADSAIDWFPDIATFYAFKGSTLERLGRYDEAIGYLNKAVLVDSTDVASYISLAYIHHERKEWGEGAAVYEKALAIEPDNPLIMNNYAYMLSVQNAELEKALSLIDSALEYRPDEPTYLDTKAWVLYRLGRLSEAFPVIMQAVEGEPESSEVHYHLGMILQAMGIPADAKKAFQRAVELEPENEEYQRLAR